MLVNFTCSEAVLRVRHALERLGLRALETFDLQTVRSAGSECVCPRHGTADCDCQLVVLMVYGEGTVPAPLMLHGADGQTWIALPGGPAGDVDPLIEAAIAASVKDNEPAEGL